MILARNAARHVALSLGGLLPFHRGRSEVRFLYGHSLDERDVPAFRRTLRMLRDRFAFISMRDAVAMARSSAPPDGRYLALSFDDGFRDNHDVIAPVLDEFGARACFFLATSFIDCDETYRRGFLRERLRARPDLRPMSWDMVRALADAGFEIGAHTRDHVNLAALPTDVAVLQVLDSKRVIESNLDAECRLFAWPYGTSAHFPATLLPGIAPHFDAVFSAIRCRATFSYGGRVINRDHFEPAWPTRHVRFFVRRPILKPSVSGLI